ncbi:Lsr2 family protein [Geodermatophilus sp. DSM 45219]|uniref:histone-like nucleoid-structuring protein Lsr2 n=1 Tax=Geodermatophilus sp. DSM 45219 TaxID=1881103 RepID=UPI00087F1553|nr:Lsr2 family protein [Geodermatophilus sp. DSM 45219]SDN41666.1 Lsr2 protein [Geodermatophilus sp. DSM 45219]
MATKTEVRLIDDLTGEAADTTVKFALDGTDYELDLSDKNAGEMRETFAKYVIAARKVAGGGRRGGRASKPTFAEVDPAAVRAWAAAQGVAVSSRGRISKDVIEKYRAAGN